MSYLQKKSSEDDLKNHINILRIETKKWYIEKKNSKWTDWTFVEISSSYSNHLKLNARVTFTHDPSNV